MTAKRSPSPASDASAPGSPELTPRSKLRQEMAALDESSDDEKSGPIDTKSLLQKLAKSKNSAAEPASAQDKSDAEGGVEDDDNDDDDDEDILRPRGRIAARMQAGPASTAAPRSASPATGAPPTTAPDADQADDDDVFVLPHRRRRAPQARSPSPAGSASRDRSVSPGLFVSPSPSPEKSATARPSAGDDEFPSATAKNPRFQALVTRKREERLAKEAAEQRKRDERAIDLPANDSGFDDEDVSDITDDDGGRKLTQEATKRPSARKASKKALEEMNRETQRMNRNLQLAHEAKTKKKIPKATLFERFNFRPANLEAPAVNESNKAISSSRPTTPVSAPHTDAEMAEAGTPPSSPPLVLHKTTDVPVTTAPEVENAVAGGENIELPDATAQTKRLDKGKGKATAADLAPSPQKKPTGAKRQVRVKFPVPPVQANTVSLDDSDSDSELQILNPKQSKVDAIFTHAPRTKSRESRSMHVLQQLAQLHSSPPRNSRQTKSQKPSMNLGELEVHLRQQARAQAKQERERRLEALKAKGIVVQTEEEREREREQVEDIVTRARREAEEIMARERDDAKKARKEKKRNGEDDDALGWDDSDDDSFEGSDLGEPVEEGEIEFSGSDDESADGSGEEEEEAEDEDDNVATNPLFDEDAEEEEQSGDLQKATDNSDGEMDEDDILPNIRANPRRPRNKGQVVSDDEEDDEDNAAAAVKATPTPKKTGYTSPLTHRSDSPKMPTSVLRSATKTFIPGLPVPAAGPAGLGLTQIFAGTMDDSQVDEAGSGSPMEFMPSFRDFPDSQFSATAEKLPSRENSGLVPNSQAESQDRESQRVQLHLAQSQTHSFDSLVQMSEFSASQLSQQLQPTQDAGFAEYSPLKARFIEAPAGTIETVLNGTPASQGGVDEGQQVESPLVRKRGKLRPRGRAMGMVPEDDEPDNLSAVVPASPLANSRRAPTVVDQDNDEDDGVSAFKVMQKAARRKQRLQEKFDKRKSKANEMIEAQAEESEDEYAGLGGADGEDSSDDEAEAELRKEMIDDAAGNDTNEDKLAALFADRERQADAAQVDKLFHDITTGMLRKRRRQGGGENGAFDLSDSDDGGEAKRRMKRRQFAKMQKALFADERIGKIAENPRNAAFLKSIEDRGSDDEWDFGPDAPEGEAVEDSQSQSQGQDRIPDSQPAGAAASHADETPNLGRKRNRNEPDPTARLPPALRRTKGPLAGLRATSLTDVRRSLSDLLDDTSVIPATDPAEGSDGEDEQRRASANKENRLPAVVDRITLKRAGSSSVGGSSSSRLAFAASASAGVFKAPSLLKKTTTAAHASLVSQASTSSHTAGAPAGGAGGFGDDAKLRKNAGKRSGINFFARENERREKIRESEKRREAKKWKGAEGRSKVVGGLFGGGQFE